VTSHRSATRRRWLFFLLPGFLVSHWEAAASDLPEEPSWHSRPITCPADLRHLCCDELQQIFASAEGCTFPSGFGRGEVLLRTDPRHARLKARMTNRVWKGKRFEEDGYFINQWLCFRALHSYVCQGPSWLDGRPCVILEYPPDTPLFGNTRDELREVAPGVWLGMWYDREPCPKLRGFFVLECQCEKSKPRH
jgi:hypothetical protein